MMNKKLILFILIGVINLMVFIAFGNVIYDNHDKMVFLDVGQGDATLMISKNNNQVLIDGGDGKKIMDKLGKYIPFYDRTIELVVITHPDSDHISGLVDVMKYYDVEEILQAEYSCNTDVCIELDKVISDKKIKRRYAEFGQVINVGNMKAKILYVKSDEKKTVDDNDSSVIMKAEVNGKSAILMADAGFSVERDLKRLKVDIDSDILKVSHHGSKYATSAEFIEDISPQKAIISVGKNKYGHPAEEVIHRLENANIEVFRTDISGDIEIE